MGKSYDAEEVSGFMSDLCSALNWYRADADKLENAYNKYAGNDTFKGAAAKAAKRCIDRGQRNLHKENLVVQKKALARYKDMKDLFEDMVDSSPKARIDTDVLEEVKKDFQGYRKVVSDHGYNIEKIAEYLQDNFSEECEVDFTQPSYQGARDAYSEFSGPNGFIDKTIKSFEDFDEQACDTVNRSGIAAYIYDYQQAISQTSYNLLGIKIETPKVDDTYLSTITNGAAIGVKAMGGNVQNGENSNTNNLSILNSSKVDKWLSPDYKLTPEEIKEARELARKELDGVERIKGTHQPIFNNKTEEENYKKALALMNKCSGVASYCQGFMSLIGNIATVPQNIVEDIIVGGFGEIGATMVDNTFATDLSSDVRNLREQMQNSISQQEADLKLAKQNARTQHPDAFMAGDTTFKAIMYFTTEGLFAAAAEGLEISKFAAVQIAENAQDLMLDTTSVYNELIEDGNLSGSDWAGLGSNVLLNAMNNLSFSQLNELVDICKAKYAVDPVVVKKAGNVAEEASDAAKAYNDSKIKPSNPYDANAKPSGHSTKIHAKDDPTTVRSLLRENEAAEVLARHGYKIEQNPVIEGTTRNPDYRIEGEIFDCYSPEPNTGVRSIGYAIKDKVVEKKQAERVVLNLDDWLGNTDDLIKQLKDYPIDKLKEVIIVKNGEISSVYP